MKEKITFAEKIRMKIEIGKELGNLVITMTEEFFMEEFRIHTERKESEKTFII